MSEIILDEEKKKVLDGAVQEMVNSFYLVKAQQDHQRAICKRIKEELNISPKLLRGVSRIAYRDDGKKINAEVTETLDLAEELGYYVHNPEE